MERDQIISRKIALYLLDLSEHLEEFTSWGKYVPVLSQFSGYFVPVSSQFSGYVLPVLSQISELLCDGVHGRGQVGHVAGGDAGHGDTAVLGWRGV